MNEETTIQPEQNEKAIDWIEILSVFWNSRKLIAYVTGAGKMAVYFV